MNTVPEITVERDTVIVPIVSLTHAAHDSRQRTTFLAELELIEAAMKSGASETYSPEWLQSDFNINKLAGLTWPTGRNQQRRHSRNRWVFCSIARVSLPDRREIPARASADDRQVPSREADLFPPYPDAEVPYYRFLFRVTPRTAYWIVYRVYEDEGLVRVLQFRSTAQDETF